MVSTFLGFLFGLLCAWMSTIFKPVGEPTLLGLIGVVYNRALIGFLIGISKNFLPKVAKGLIIGALISYTMVLPVYGLKGLGFAVFGAIYGALIELILDYLPYE